MLAGWRAFPVIARNSTFTYKGKTVDIKKVGEELGVRYVLEGSVRKSGRRVRVTAQLIRADTNHHIMAERYDRDLTDLFELQDEIVTHDRRRDRAGTPQIRARAHRRAAAAQRGRLRTLSARHVAPLPAQQGGQRRGAGLFPARAGDRPAIPAGDRGAGDRGLQRRLSRLGRRCRSQLSTSAYELGAARGHSRCRAIRTPILRSVWSACGRAAPIARSRRSRRRSSSTRALPPPTSCSGRCTSMPGGRKRRSSWRKRASASAPAIRACSSGFPPSPGRTTSCGITRRPSRSGGARGRSIATGRTVCAMSSPGLPSSAGSRRRRLALAELKRLNTNLAFVEGNLRRLFTDEAAVDHVVGGLRKAGFE